MNIENIRFSDYNDVSNIIPRYQPNGEMQIGLPHTHQSPCEPCWGSDCRGSPYRGQTIRVLERKRKQITNTIYTNVFIRAVKYHTDQVMESIFGVILIEMANGETFHISDHGRLLRTTRNQKQPGTIAMLTKCLDTPTKNQRYISETPPQDFPWHQPHGLRETQH